MTISDFFMIIAVVLGPIIAVRVQKIIEGIRDKQKRKDDIFKTLMATRGTKLSPLHIEALNRIDLEFSQDSIKEKPIIEAWKIYLDHLNTHVDQKDPDFQSKLVRWGEKSDEYLIELLYSMAKALGYKFDKVQLKRGVYTPRGQVDLEIDQLVVRKGLIDMISGKQPLSVRIADIKPNTQVPRVTNSGS